MRTLLFSIAVIYFTNATAQLKSQWEKIDRVVWCGLDFSLMKCIGSESFRDPQKIVEDYFFYWNSVVVAEPGVHRIIQACGNKPAVFRIEIASSMNQQVGFSNLVTDEEYVIDDETLSAHIRQYPKIDQSPVALVFVAESLNKNRRRAFYHVVFFDTRNNEIIWTKRYVGGAKGYGFKYYWDMSIENVFKHLIDDMKNLVKS